MVKRRYVPISMVQPGMMADQAVLDRAGRFLVAGGTYMDEKMIASMQKMGVTGIYVREGRKEEEKKPGKGAVKTSPEIQKKFEELKAKDPARVKLQESVKQRVAEGVQYLYSDTDSANFMDTTKSITDDLMRAIADNDAIAVDIGALKISDEYTFKHSVDVATMSMVVAKNHGLLDRQVYDIGISGLLHDIGKSKVPNEILNKPGKLTDEEFGLIKKHSLYGYEILKNKGNLSNSVKFGVLQHHEKKDGSGYPFGMKADQIDLYAKIISVADIYDALVTERPYKKPFSPRSAVEMIMAMTQELDIGVMRSFMKSVILYPVGMDVELSTGEMARVIETNPNHVLRPKVIGLSTGRIYDLAADMGCADVIIL